MEKQFSKYQLIQKLTQQDGWTSYLAKTSGISGFEKIQVIAISDKPRSDIYTAIKAAEQAFSRNHNNIVQTLEYGVADGLGYVSTEYIPGPSLLSLIEGIGRIKQTEANKNVMEQFPIATTVFILGELVAAIDYLVRTQNKPATGQIPIESIAISWQGSIKILASSLGKDTAHYSNIAQILRLILQHSVSTSAVFSALSAFADLCASSSEIKHVQTAYHHLCRTHDIFGDALGLADCLAWALPFRDREHDFRWDNTKTDNQRKSQDDMITHPRLIIARRADQTWADSDGRVPVVALHVQSDNDERIHQHVRDQIADSAVRFSGTIHRQNPVSILAVFGLPYPKEIDFNQAVAMAKQTIKLAAEHDLSVRCSIRIGVAIYKVSRGNALRVSLRGSLAKDCADMASKTPPMTISTSGIAAQLGDVDFHLEQIGSTLEFGRKKIIFLLSGPRVSRLRKGSQRHPYQQREDEVARIEKSFSTFMRNRRSFVCRVEGAPGIGKSTFLSKLSNETFQKYAPTLHLEVMPNTIATPMFVGKEIIEFLFKNESLNPIINKQLNRDKPSSDVSKIWTSIKPSLPKLVKENTVIVIDNFQWVDPASIALISNMLGELRKGIFLILATRPTEKKSLREYERLRIRLPMLSQDALLSMMDNFTTTTSEPQAIDSETKQQLVALSGGNPLYLAELTRRHSVHNSKVSAENIPPILYPLILEEIDSINRAHMGLLRFLFILQSPFTENMLKTVADRDCADYLDDAIKSDILVTDAGLYRFRCPLTRHAVIEMILPATKKRYSDHICPIIMANFADDLSPEQTADLLCENEKRVEADPYYQKAITTYIDTNKPIAAKRVLIKRRQSHSALSKPDLERVHSDDSWTAGSRNNQIGLAQCTMLEGNYDKALSYLAAIAASNASDEQKQEIRVWEMTILREKEALAKAYEICRNLRDEGGKYAHIKSKSHLVEVSASHLAMGQPLRSHAILNLAEQYEKGTHEKKDEASSHVISINTLDSIRLDHELYGDGTVSTIDTLDSVRRSKTFLPCVPRSKRDFASCRELYLSGNFHRAILAAESLLRSDLADYRTKHLANLNIAKSAFRTGCYDLAKKKAQCIISRNESMLFASRIQAFILCSEVYMAENRRGAALEQLNQVKRLASQTGRLEYMSLKLAEAKIFWRLKADHSDLARSFDASSVALAESKKAGIVSAAALAAALGAVVAKEMGDVDATIRLARSAISSADSLELTEYPLEEIYLTISASLFVVDLATSRYCITKAMAKASDIRGRIESRKYKECFDVSQITKRIHTLHQAVEAAYNGKKPVSLSSDDPIKI